MSVLLLMIYSVVGQAALHRCRHLRFIAHIHFYEIDTLLKQFVASQCNLVLQRELARTGRRGALPWPV